MKYSFVLNERKKDGETTILFSVYFKTEGRKFIYSTGESIDPNEWDFKARQPNNLTGRTKQAKRHREIKTQLGRYSSELERIAGEYKIIGEALTIKMLRSEFDSVFKKGKSKPNSFFPIYDQFLEYKKKEGVIKHATVKRYNSVRATLVDFEKDTKYKLSFGRMNDTFYIEYMNYCRTEKKHTQNTLGRNIGAIKTFLGWAYKKKYHFNKDYENFKKVSAETNEIALTQKDLDLIWEYDFSEKLRLERVRDLFMFGCVTGLRYSDYSCVNRGNINGDNIQMISKKTSDALTIPLNDYSQFILMKYDYDLPTISEQKFREYIKEVCEIVGLDQPTIKTTFIGSQRFDEEIPKYKRVSSHTARRTFITLSLEKGMRPEVVKGITGHKNLQSFAKYIKISPEVRKREMKATWEMNFTPLKKAN